MKIKDYLKESSSIVFRNKKKRFYILIATISTVLLYGILIFNSNLNTYVNQSIAKNIGFRTLIIPAKANTKELEDESLKKIQYVEEVYSTKYSPQSLETNFKNRNLDGQIEIMYGTINTIPNVVSGRGFKKDEINSMICPINFYPNSSIFNIDSKYIINGKDILGKEVILKYNAVDFVNGKIVKDKISEMKVKIVGLYDNKSVMGLNNQCYITSRNMIEIVDTILKNESDTIYYNYYVVVDDISNLESVIKNAIKLGFDENNIYISNSLDTEQISIIRISIIILLSLILFVIIVINSSYTKKRILNEKANIGILRACGYNKKNIRNLYLLEIFFTNIFSYVIGTALFLIIYIVLNSTALKLLAILGINISFDTLSVIFPLVIILIIPVFIAIININRKEQLEIINLISNDGE